MQNHSRAFIFDIKDLFDMIIALQHKMLGSCPRKSNPKRRSCLRLYLNGSYNNQISFDRLAHGRSWGM